MDAFGLTTWFTQSCCNLILLLQFLQFFGQILISWFSGLTKIVLFPTLGKEDPPREIKSGSICPVSFTGGREDPHRKRKSICQIHILKNSGFESNRQHSDSIRIRALFRSHRYGGRQVVTSSKTKFNCFYGMASSFSCPHQLIHYY